MKTLSSGCLDFIVANFHANGGRLRLGVDD
jgi:hypothetical protein